MIKGSSRGIGHRMILYGVVNTISNALSLRDPCRTEYTLMTRLLSQFLCGKGLFFYAFAQNTKGKVTVI